MEAITEETDSLLGSWAAIPGDPRPHVYQEIDAIEWNENGKDPIFLRYMSICGRSFSSQGPVPCDRNKKKCSYCEGLVAGRQLKLL